MGLDAFVRCNCWGSRPPEPPELRGLTCVDDYDDSIDLRAPYRHDVTLFRRLQEWIRSFCPHEEMELVSEHVSNWGGVSAFLAALHSAGADRFPALIAAMPKANGGRADVTTARRMLAELDAFDAAGVLGRRTVLIAEDDESEVRDVAAGNECVMALSASQQVGLDDHGVFVQRGDEVVFRSRRFEQILEPVTTPNSTTAILRALDSGQSCSGVIAIGHYGVDESGRYRPSHARCFRVEIASLTSAKYGYITASLRKLCNASIATGNPILWS